MSYPLNEIPTSEALDNMAEQEYINLTVTFFHKIHGADAESPAWLDLECLVNCWECGTHFTAEPLTANTVDKFGLWCSTSCIGTAAERQNTIARSIH